MDQHPCIQEARLRALETENAESKVYLKIIREDIGEIKAKLNEPREPPPPTPQAPQPPPPSSQMPPWWQPVVLKVVELIMMAMTILGVIAGAKELFIKGG